MSGDGRENLAEQIGRDRWGGGWGTQGLDRTYRASVGRLGIGIELFGSRNSLTDPEAIFLVGDLTLAQFCFILLLLSISILTMTIDDLRSRLENSAGRRGDPFSICGDRQRLPGISAHPFLR